MNSHELVVARFHLYIPTNVKVNSAKKSKPKHSYIKKLELEYKKLPSYRMNWNQGQWDNFTSLAFTYIGVMIKMFVTHFVINVIFAHQILVFVTTMRCHDFYALADWSPKLTMSCTPIHIHSVDHTGKN